MKVAWKAAPVAALLGMCTGCATSPDAERPITERNGSGSSTTTVSDAVWSVAVLEHPDIDTCPDLSADDWIRAGDHMFSDGTPGLGKLEYFPLDLPLQLRRFCLYRYAGLAALPALPTDPVFSHVSFDEAVVEPMGNGLDSAYRPALREMFVAQAGRLAPGTERGSMPVTVAVIDTEWEYGEGTPLSEHASAMAGIVKALACPLAEGDAEAQCAVSIFRALALPLSETGEELIDGGLYGTRSHVAMAIVESVQAWRKNMIENEAPQSRLVLNLSLGWVASMPSGCGMGEDEPWCESSGSHARDFEQWAPQSSPLQYSARVADEAVHVALLYAACNGATVVASAGNGKDDSCNDRPMAPAVWSSYGTPSAADCQLLEFEPPGGFTAGPVHDPVADPRPFVQPVSAVDHLDEPIFVTRPQSQTRIAAPGYLATTGDGRDPLTGTSVSAAVVSAGAALLWSFDHEKAPTEVLDRLYDTGTPLLRSWELPESGVHNPEDTVGRVSLCRAVDPMCETAACESSLCDPEDDLEMRLGDLRSEVEAQLATMTTTPAAISSLSTETCHQCGQPITAMLPATSAQPHYFFSSCGTNQSAYMPTDGPSLAGPQPDDPPCPDCPLVVSSAPDPSRAVLALDDWYWNANNINVLGMSITLRRNGMSPVFIDLSGNQQLIAALMSGQTASVSLPGQFHSASNPLRKASFGISFSVGQAQYYRSNQMLVLPPQ